MCKDCGCSRVERYAVDGATTLVDAAHAHSHDHSHSHDHPHDHGPGHSHDHSLEDSGSAGMIRRTLDLQLGLLSKNDRLAERNRGYFQAKGLLAINVFSSPGSGKTALLERTAAELGERVPMGVVVGDLETDHDAERIRRAGIPAAQITTGNVCHLEAEMVARAIARLPLDRLRVLFIENVGNLVCPAAYDLGEELRVVLLSVTEGEDKPLKYPTAFSTAQVVIVSKADIADAVGFDREAALDNIRRAAPQAAVFELSARTGEGFDAWTAYLEHRAGRKAHHEIAQPGGARLP